MPTVIKYPLPPILTGVCTTLKYHKWLTCKADQLNERDKKLNRPYGLKFSVADYKMKIHNDVLKNNGLAPYSGDTLRWDLMGKWNDNNDNRSKTSRRFPGLVRGLAMKKEFFLLPVIDHVDPYASELEFEIVSWVVNEGKSLLTPAEYKSLCARVVGYGKKCITPHPNAS
jgi:hypothetical protein